jgi:hypothetical protein
MKSTTTRQRPANLALLAAPEEVDALLALLRAAPAQTWKAKDILRASGLPLLRSTTRTWLLTCTRSSTASPCFRSCSFVGT